MLTAMDDLSAVLVSVIVPIRNERAHILACLESVLASDYPPERLEVLAVDGMSDDGTRDFIADLARRDPRMRLLDNPERVSPHGLNRGIAAARGEIIVRMDAHAIYPPDYVRRCVARLISSGAANVGGVWETVAGAPTLRARTIAVALGHPFGVGNAHYRIGTGEPRWVDTVPFGCWRRDLLLDLGGFAPDLPRNQDDELNARILRRGGRILLDPSIRCRYIARPTLRQLSLMLYQYGYYKPFVAHRIGGIITGRQLVPPLFVAALCTFVVTGFVWPRTWAVFLGILVIHLVAGLTVGLAARLHRPAVVLQLPFVFMVMHGAYGWGYLWGLFNLLARRRPSLAVRLSR